MIKVTQKLLQEIADLKIIKLSGSYARGDERLQSDIDFNIKEDRPWPVPKIRNIDKVRAFLEKRGITWSSPFSGSISTTNTDIQLEFSDIFPQYKNGFVEVMGIKFRT